MASAHKPRTTGPARAEKGDAAWFGFRRVAPGEKADLVQGVFASVAARYDLMNDLMSGGLHRRWKDRLVTMMRPKPGDVILDVAGGTGDIARRCYKRTRGQARILVCDRSADMIAIGKKRVMDAGIAGRGHGIEWIEGDAEKLPLQARSVDIYCISFGLRNVTHIDKALEEASRVLRPGGRFFCLEFSPGVQRHIRPIYDRYCQGVLPWIGRVIAEDQASYQYLAESIQTFPDQLSLKRRIEAAGLERAEWTNLTGGIAVIHAAWKL
ncbi:MAG: class I SAM-dependent methyltransferase [Pseudomonadota bacterium]|nr:class I SAM-dependent methyltransferase [Pseudomonadota bacterium]